MVMCRIREMVKSLNLPVMAAGLFLTAALDYGLVANQDRLDGEIFTPYAIHRLEGVENMVTWWDVVTRLISSKLMMDTEDFMAHPQEPQMVMAMNPMIRSIQILPEEGKPLIFTADDAKKVEITSLLHGRLQKAADTARKANRLVLLDSVDLGLPYKTMVLLRPVFKPESRDADSFWGYIAVVVDQREVMSSANISNLGKQHLDYTLYHKYRWEQEAHLVKGQGTTGEGNPRAVRVIAGDVWTIVLRPQGSRMDWQLLFFATVAGLSLTTMISFLLKRNGALRKTNGLLKRIGGRDPLTGVYNRKGGDGAVADYLKAHAGKKAMVIALDIDNFKLVNDVYGHSVGDEALKTLVRDMKEIFGEKSIITRNGGDEFVLFHPYEDFSRAAEAMDRFTRNLHTFMAGDKEVKFYASLGCAAYPEQGDSYGSLCIRADYALYGAKLNGKAGWRRFDDSQHMTDRRDQLSFNLSDVANHLPGGVLVLKATENEEILFANKVMVDILECDDYEDFMKYTGGNLFSVIYPEDRTVMRKEFHRQLDQKDNDRQIDFLTFRMMTKKGRIIQVEDTAKKSVSPFYGELYYVFLYKREDRLKIMGN